MPHVITTEPLLRRGAMSMGHSFQDTCLKILTSMGFNIQGALLFDEVGVEVDAWAENKRNQDLLFLFRGSSTGVRPGLTRNNAIRAVIGEASLLKATQVPPIIVLTSDPPVKGRGETMVKAAITEGIFYAVFNVWDPAHFDALQELAFTL